MEDINRWRRVIERAGLTRGTPPPPKESTREEEGTEGCDETSEWVNGFSWTHNSVTSSSH